MTDACYMIFILFAKIQACDQSSYKNGTMHTIKHYKENKNCINKRYKIQ